MVTIDSQWRLGPNVDTFPQSVIENEPMMFRADFDFALEHGGPITRHFVAALLPYWMNDPTLKIDSRAHMLMPGFYPCIPGWHHDDVPRTRPDGQPEYIEPDYEARHCMALFGGDVAPTYFATGKIELPDAKSGEITYGKWHPLIERAIQNNELQQWIAPSDQLIYFDWQTLHRGSRAVGRGWRFFIRASVGNPAQARNTIRKQVQVYLDAPMQGW